MFYDRLLAVLRQPAPRDGRLPFADLGTGQWRLQDLIGAATCNREGNDLQTRGLYLNVSPWKASVFSLTKYDATAP